MIVITGTIKLSSEEQVSRARSGLIARAERSAKDAGYIDYAFSQDFSDPTLIRLVEKWESEEHLQAHIDVPDEEFSALMANADIQAAEVIAYDTDSGRVLMGG
ncbi:MAG: putative quinol monooxygenase [Pseudomonadales bacterium]